jgi:hypothetical protein
MLDTLWDNDEISRFDVFLLSAHDGFGLAGGEEEVLVDVMCL